MIAKTTTGQSFSNLANYLMQDDKHSEVLEQQNCFSAEPRQLAQQFENIAEGNKRCTKPVMHHSLSFAERDITAEKMTEVAKDFAEQMGYEQYSIVRHNDTDHAHLHIMANRVRFDGSVLSNAYSKTKAKKLAQKLELKYDLQQVKEVKRVQKINSTNLTKKQEREKIYKVAESYFRGNRERTAQGFVDYVREQGIAVSVNKSKDGTKVNGLSFQIEGSKMKHKASQVHSDLKWNNLQKAFGQGLNKKSKLQMNTLDVSKSANALLQLINIQEKASQQPQYTEEESEKEEQNIKQNKGMSL